jgi:fructose-bisphosphate aldolase class I
MCLVHALDIMYTDSNITYMYGESFAHVGSTPPQSLAAAQLMTAKFKFEADLIKTARAIATPGKGILAADESSSTIESRLKSIGLQSTPETRRDYRDVLFGAKGLGQYISGVILYEETLFQKNAAGRPFVEILLEQGIIPGIKVDKGIKPIPGTNGESVTQGLDDLADRCVKYYKEGARFAKWRAVLKIGPNEPSELAITENARNLARYAVICQENGLVPIVEPEVLMDGNHTIERCAYECERVLAGVFKALHDHHVLLEGMLLKPNMVLPGQDSGQKATPHEVASYTLRTLQRCVPPAVPGIMFLSGGQGEEEATLNLNAMNVIKTQKPWLISFSYARALQNSALKTWKGLPENVEAARQKLLERAKADSEAQLGKYAGGANDPSAQQSLFQTGYVY